MYTLWSFSHWYYLAKLQDKIMTRLLRLIQTTNLTGFLKFNVYSLVCVCLVLCNLKFVYPSPQSHKTIPSQGSLQLPFCNPTPLVTTDLSYNAKVLLFQESYINGIRYYVTTWDWLFSLIITPCWLTHVVARTSSLPIFLLSGFHGVHVPKSV